MHARRLVTTSDLPADNDLEIRLRRSKHEYAVVTVRVIMTASATL